MIIKCESCNAMLEAPDSLTNGQPVRCPYCKEKFLYSTKQTPTKIALQEEFANQSDTNCRGKNSLDFKIDFMGRLLRCRQPIWPLGEWLLEMRKPLLVACAIIAFSCMVVGQCSGITKPHTGNIKGFSSDVKNLIRQQYANKKEWYNSQLNYNGLREIYFIDRDGVATLCLYGENGQKVNIMYMYEYGFIQYSRSIQKGFAQELINARMFIENYEKNEKR